MKTIQKFFGLVLVAVTFFSFSAQAKTMVNETNTELGKYWLKKAVNPMVVNDKELPTYVVHYDNLPNPVYIGVYEKGNCKMFLVRTEGFEVAYAQRDGIFGINYMPEQLATLTQSVSKSSIDRVNFLRQCIITSKHYSEKKQLGLVASYLPEVMK